MLIFLEFIIGLIELVVNILEIINDDEKDKDKNNRNYNYNNNNNRYKTIFKV